MNKNKKRIVVFTCSKKNTKNDYKNIWTDIIKRKLEKKYGKIK